MKKSPVSLYRQLTTKKSDLFIVLNNACHFCRDTTQNLEANTHRLDACELPPPPSEQLV